MLYKYTNQSLRQIRRTVALPWNVGYVVGQGHCDENGTPIIYDLLLVCHCNYISIKVKVKR